MQYLVTATDTDDNTVQLTYTYTHHKGDYAHSSHLVSIMQNLDIQSLDMVAIVAVKNDIASDLQLVTVDRIRDAVEYVL